MDLLELAKAASHSDMSKINFISRLIQLLEQSTHKRPMLIKVEKLDYNFGILPDNRDINQLQEFITKIVGLL